jgi:Glycosyl hydrolase family 47
LTRDRYNPRNFELNDVLGNYSLTLIDSLSTLAILASSPPDKRGTGPKALRDFQNGVAALVTQYGDGTDGPSGKGLRARGFDLDSKVQVFETVIRGVGGLLSAHLFASGELPIKWYKLRRLKRGQGKFPPREIHPPILWPNGFKYDGQLLRLALDLAQRLLPAFYTNTGLPYPRVNLRHGIPFYQNSPLNQGSDSGQCDAGGSLEITETCSAGAGSLVLEFTVLSRLTGDQRFEQLAKRAFWSVWDRRSSIGLIGAGVDAEGGHWIGPYAGIGAGTDSFFEYALKTHILLSGLDTPNTTISSVERQRSYLDPNTIFKPLSDEENSSDSFLHAWQDAHAAIKRHLYTNTHHPHYVNVHLSTGSPQTYWIDSLGAYYPGLLTLAGELDEAIETNLLYTALWTRYSALPERWSVRDGQVEGGLGWWPGRPEFIESNYHIYRATKDPWYLHVGEMVLKDIKRRCWTKCGWAGLQDVRTGEKSDRMESFFLGETAKYLYLLFDPQHPLNSLDAPFVFTTEGHPLIIPRKSASRENLRQKLRKEIFQPYVPSLDTDTCPVPPASVPLTISATAARLDIFHAASLTGLHRIPNMHARESEESRSSAPISDPKNFPNHTYYPWTLPMNLVPEDSTCALLPSKTTLNIEFPSNTLLGTPPAGFNVILGHQALVRINDEGILVKSLEGVKLGMVEESPSSMDGIPLPKSWRIKSVGNIALGRDEKVLIPRDVIGPMADPSFTRIRDPVMLDLVLQVENSVKANLSIIDLLDIPIREDATLADHPDIQYKESMLSTTGIAAEYKTMLSSLLHQVTSALRDPAATTSPQPENIPTYHFKALAAVAPIGAGAAPILDINEAPDPTSNSGPEPLSWTTVFFAGESCDQKLSDEAAKFHQVIVMKRGGCTFSKKLTNVPSFSPSSHGFQFLIIVSDDPDYEQNAEEKSQGTRLIRPFLDELQYTPSGLLRHHQISMALVGGGEQTYELLRGARSIGLRRRYHVESQGIPISNLIVI